MLLCSQEEKVGGDLAGGYAIAILATCFDNDHHLISKRPTLSKDGIRRRMQWISTSLPHFSPPSRNHLLRINDFLLSEDYKPDKSQDLVNGIATLSTQ